MDKHAALFVALLSAAVACGGSDERPPPGGTGPSSGVGGSTTAATSTGAGASSAGGGGGVAVGCSEAGEVSYASPVTEDVAFTADSTDAIQLFGRLFIPEAGGSFATVVLLHQYCDDLTDWTEVSTLADDLAGAGFLVLAYDARGHGQSDDNGNLDLCGETAAPLFEPMVADVTDALTFLEGRSEANLDCLATVGGSMGANVSLLHAASDERVSTVVLFSPGLNYFGLSTQAAIGSFDPRESLMFATELDDYSANTLVTLGDASDAATTVTLPGDAHGAVILATHEEAREETLAWLAARL